MTKPVQLLRVESDDNATQENQQTLTGLHTVIAYPPVFDRATLCYVSVTASAGRGSTNAAVFAVPFTDRVPQRLRESSA